MVFKTVILAAGQGLRAGGYKPLWKLGEGAVIDRVIEAASSVSDEIRVVGGAFFEKLKVHMKSNHPGVTLLENRSWKEGMFTSVQVGMEGLDCPVFVHPADIPGPGMKVYSALRRALEHDAQDIDVIRPAFNDRPGHPILLNINAVRRAQRAPASTTLRDVLRPLRRLDLPVDDELILQDFDTLEDFQKLKPALF